MSLQRINARPICLAAVSICEYGRRTAGGCPPARSEERTISTTEGPNRVADVLSGDGWPGRAPGAGRPTFAPARIIAVEAIPYVLPLDRPLGFASGEVAQADNVLVRVHSDAGVTGIAEAQPRPYTYGETQATIVSVVRDVLGPRLVGRDPLDVEHAHQACASLAGNNVARGAVDLAVWDLAGRLLGLPATRLLGGWADDLRVAYMVSFGEPAAMAGDALRLREQAGVETFKIKVGRDPDLDVAAVRAVREAVPTADLYVDANRGWSYEQALRAGDALVELGVRAIEEPLALTDRAGRRRLADRWPVPLAGDESCISLAHVDREIDDGAVRAVSVKTARTGFTESRRIVALCLGRAVPVVVGSQYEGALGALASIAFAAAFEGTTRRPAEVANFRDLAGDLLVAAPEIRDGRVRVSDAPGFGADLDDERLDHARVDR